MTCLGCTAGFTFPSAFQRSWQARKSAYHVWKPSQEPGTDRLRTPRRGVLSLTCLPQGLGCSGSQWTGTRKSQLPPDSPTHCSNVHSLVAPVTLVLEILHQKISWLKQLKWIKDNVKNRGGGDSPALNKSQGHRRPVNLLG